MPNSTGAERRRAKAERKQMQATRDKSTRDWPWTHPHRSANALSNRQPRTTSDLLSRGAREAAQWGLARRPSEIVQAGPAQGRLAAAQGDAELPR
jgi:hypothetical protein